MTKHLTSKERDVIVGAISTIAVTLISAVLSSFIKTDDTNRA